jgi:tetratricopeptide (TPR) repeat protein
MAREDTFGYRAGKYLQRNRVGVLAGSLAAASLLAAVVMTSHEARRAQQARQVAETQRGVAVAERWRAEEQRNRAEEEHKTADRERDVASNASEVATLRAREAEAEKQKAQQRLGDLVSLANQSLFDVQGVLERVPNTLEARRDVLASTLKYLDGLAAENRDDPEVLAVLVSGYTQSGDVLGNPSGANLGNRDEAVAAWTKARTVLARLEAIEPDKLRPRLQDLGLHQRIGTALEAEGKLPAAIAEYTTSLDQAEKVARDFPSNALCVAQPGMIGHSLAAALAKTDNRAAERRIHAAIGAWEKANALQPDGQFYQGLAAALGLLGQILEEDNRPAEGLEQYRRSLDVRMKMLAAHPNDPIVRGAVASAWLHIAGILNGPWQANLGDPRGAMEAMEKSLASYEDLSAEDAANRRAKSDLARALAYAGAMGTDTARSLARLRRAAGMLNDLRGADPKQVSYRTDLAFAHEYLGHRLRDNGDMPGAIAEYRLSLETQENPGLAAKVAEYEKQILRAASR